MKVSLFLLLLLVTASVLDDYSSGAYSEITPRRDGGFNVYDYGFEGSDDGPDDESNLFMDEDP